MIECPACEGRGSPRSDIFLVRGGGRPLPSKPSSELCDVCDGAGWLWPWQWRAYRRGRAARARGASMLNGRLRNRHQKARA